MVVTGYFGCGKNVSLLTAFFAIVDSIFTGMNRYAASKVGQSETRATVAAIGRAKQRKKRLVLANR